MAKGTAKTENPSMKAEIASLEKVREKLLTDCAEKDKRISDLLIENKGLKEVNKKAYADLTTLKASLNKDASAVDGAEYVEIVAVPAQRRMRLGRFVINGVEVPGQIDEDGFEHFVVPKENAKQLISASDSRHVLVGPVDYLDTKVIVGAYEQPKRCLKHRKIVAGGEPQWVPVEIETPKGS
jgi:hypothetical protein